MEEKRWRLRDGDVDGVKDGTRDGDRDNGMKMNRSESRLCGKELRSFLERRGHS